MKTFRTVLATFGITTLFYGAFALLTVGIDPAFAGRSVYQMFRETGFPALVIGIACLLSALIILFTGAAFRDDPKSKRASMDDDDFFLENETVGADEYDEEWVSSEKEREQNTPDADDGPSAETPDLFSDDDNAAESDASAPSLDESLFASSRSTEPTRYCIFCGTAYPTSAAVCPKCGKRS